MQYLFSGDSDISITGFGGPMVGFTAIGDEFEVNVGGGGAVLFNQRFLCWRLRNWNSHCPQKGHYYL